ncbi:MAG: hydrogenase nickel incorporation protein HypB [Promethearchaeia archaeon]
MSEKNQHERIIELNEDLVSNNDNLALKNQQKLEEYKIKSFDVVGAIGAGKTALIETIVEKIKDKKVLVLNGDVSTTIDANRIKQHGVKSIQINTGRECALNSYHISQVLKNIDLEDYKGGLIFIENVGNLICPSDFILGADKRIVVVSVTEGPWVVRKHPLLFKMSDLAIINKFDLKEHMDVSIDEMKKDVSEINPNLQTIITSAKTGKGLNQVMEALGIQI